MTTDTPTQAYEFDRYINGILMAEGVTIERQKSLEDAMRAAALIAPRGPNGEAPVLVHRLASQPEAGDPVVWEPIETAPKDGSYVDLWCAPLTEAGVALLPWPDRKRRSSQRIDR